MTRLNAEITWSGRNASYTSDSIRSPGVCSLLLRSSEAHGTPSSEEYAPRAYTISSLSDLVSSSLSLSSSFPLRFAQNWKASDPFIRSFVLPRRRQEAGERLLCSPLEAPPADSSCPHRGHCRAGAAPGTPRQLAFGSVRSIPIVAFPTLFFLGKSGPVEDQWRNQRRGGSRRRCGRQWNRPRSFRTRLRPSSLKPPGMRSHCGSERQPWTLPSAACGPRSVPCSPTSSWIRILPTRQATPHSYLGFFSDNSAVLFCRLHAR